MFEVSVILPKVTDTEKFDLFCNSLFSDKVSIELLVCNCADNFDKGQYQFNNITFVEKQEHELPINVALRNAKGNYIMFSDENVVFSSNAISTMLENTENNSCACNVSDENGNMFREKFMLDELASKNVYCNHLIRKSMIDTYSVKLYSETDFGIMCFLSLVYKYEEVSLIHSTLLHMTEVNSEVISSQDVEAIPNFTKEFSSCDKYSAVIFYIRNAFNYLYNDERMVLLKALLYFFKENYVVNSWVNSNYQLDISDFINESDKNIHENIFYKEVKMPMLPDAMAMEFEMGKQGSSTLKKCFVGYLKYNLYIKKGNKITEFIFKILIRLLGGGTNV